VTVRFRADHHAQLEREARGAFPRECCGLIEGRRDGEDLEISVLHPCRNLARHDDAFEIDPAEQFRLMRALRGTGRAIIGCYHSHPNGSSEPSSRDLAGASEDGFLWLIVAIGDHKVRIGAGIWEAGRFTSVSISGPRE
jgi:proteasome lid subunit RPN8/RPN11